MNKYLKITLLYWLPVLIWMGVIFYWSHQPDLKTPLGIWDTILRKFAHVFEFGILTLLIWRALAQHQLHLIKIILITLGAALLYAASDEFHQAFIGGRSSNAIDVLIDCIGIAIVLIILWIYYRKKEIEQVKSKLV